MSDKNSRVIASGCLIMKVFVFIALLVFVSFESRAYVSYVLNSRKIVTQSGGFLPEYYDLWKMYPRRWVGRFPSSMDSFESQKRDAMYWHLELFFESDEILDRMKEISGREFDQCEGEAKGGGCVKRALFLAGHDYIVNFSQSASFEKSLSKDEFRRLKNLFSDKYTVCTENFWELGFSGVEFHDSLTDKVREFVSRWNVCTGYQRCLNFLSDKTLNGGPDFSFTIKECLVDQFQKQSDFVLNRIVDGYFEQWWEFIPGGSDRRYFLDILKRNYYKPCLETSKYPEPSECLKKMISLSDGPFLEYWLLSRFKIHRELEEIGLKLETLEANYRSCSHKVSGSKSGIFKCFKKSLLFGENEFYHTKYSRKEYMECIAEKLDGMDSPAVVLSSFETESSACFANVAKKQMEKKIALLGDKISVSAGYREFMDANGQDVGILIQVINNFSSFQKALQIKNDLDGFFHGFKKELARSPISKETGKRLEKEYRKASPGLYEIFSGNLHGQDKNYERKLFIDVVGKLSSALLFNAGYKDVLDDKSYHGIIENCVADSLSGVDSAVRMCPSFIFREMVLIKEKNDLEIETVKYLPGKSDSARNVFSAFNEMESCMMGVDPAEGIFAKHPTTDMMACVHLGRLDFYFRMSVGMAGRFLPLMERDKNGNIITELNSCFINLGKKYFGQVSGELRKNEVEYVFSSKRDRAIFDFFRADGFIGNIQSIDSALLKLSEKNISRDDVRKDAISCYMKTKRSVAQGFRRYFLNFMPDEIIKKDYTSKYFKIDGIKTYEDVIMKFVDIDLINFLMDLKVIKTDTDVLITTEPYQGDWKSISSFGMEVIAKIALETAIGVSRGLEFDKLTMAAMLSDFRQQLDSLMKWFNDGPRSVSDIGDMFVDGNLATKFNEAVKKDSPDPKEIMGVVLADIFKSNDVSDFMTISILAGKLIERGKNSLSEAKKEEIKRIKIKRTKMVNSINRRYQKLTELMDRMTLSFDMRRIMNKESEDGRELIDFAKNNYVIPILCDVERDSKKEYRMWQLAGRMIVEDYTDGGFAEQFTGIIADEIFSNWKNNKWIIVSDSSWKITEWFFGTKHSDYDWEKIRNTRSGQIAIKRYAQTILLPRIVGYRFSKKIQQDNWMAFTKLLGKAMSEN